MATLQELIDQKQALERQIIAARDSQKNEALTKIRQLMAENGLTVADVTAAKTTRKGEAGLNSTAGKPVAAKYRHPETQATWSGRGLKPRWLAEELAKGKAIADFAI